MNLNRKHRGKMLYQFKLLGVLPEKWEEMFGCALISEFSQDDGSKTTILSMMVVDKAELHGVINQLMGLNLDLVYLHLISNHQTIPTED